MEMKFLRVLIHTIKENELESLLRVTNVCGVLTGLTLFQESNFASAVARSFIVAINLIFVTYMYIVGIVVYIQMYELDLIAKIQIAVYVIWYLEYCNYLLWVISTRPAVKEVIEMIRESDLLARENKALNEKHKTLLSSIKLFIIVFYVGITIDVAVYISTHIAERAFTDPTVFGTVVCVGMDDLITNPNKAICSVAVALYVMIFGTLVMYYTAVFLFMVGHLTVTYELLAEEMKYLVVQFKPSAGLLEGTDVAEPNNLQLDQKVVREYLRILIHRYSLLLRTTKKIKNLFSTSIGIDTGVNLMLTFIIIILPLRDFLKLSAYLGFAILHMTLYCVACQRLEDVSKRFELAVYCCGWENLDVNNRKSVLIILMRAQKLVKFPAAGVIPLNIKSIGDGVQALYKFSAAFKV